MIAENGSVVELTPRGVKIVDRIAAGVTFVDGLGVGDVQDVALRDRRRLSEDGVLIVVTTVAVSDGGEIAPPELIARGFGDNEELLDELRDEADRVAEELAEDGITEIKLLQEHMHDAIAKLVYARTRRRPMILPVVIEVSTRAGGTSGWGSAHVGRGRATFTKATSLTAGRAGHAPAQTLPSRTPNPRASDGPGATAARVV